MTIFKSKGMQWRHAYTLGDVVKKENKKIAYYNPENRIIKEGLTVLYDTHKTLVLFSEKTETIYQFENNWQQNNRKKGYKPWEKQLIENITR